MDIGKILLENGFPGLTIAYQNIDFGLCIDRMTSFDYDIRACAIVCAKISNRRMIFSYLYNCCICIEVDLMCYGVGFFNSSVQMIFVDEVWKKVIECRKNIPFVTLG